MRCCGILPPPKNHSRSSKIWVYVGKWVTWAEVRGGAKSDRLTSHQRWSHSLHSYTATSWLSTSSLPSLQRTSSSVRPREEGRIAELAFHTLTPCRKACVGPEFHPSLTTTLIRREHKLPPRQAQLLCLSSFLLIRAYLILGFYCCM